MSKAREIAKGLSEAQKEMILRVAAGTLRTPNRSTFAALRRRGLVVNNVTKEGRGTRNNYTLTPLGREVAAVLKETE